MSLYACIEAGGTKFICAVMTETGEIAAETRIPTTSPERTLAEAAAFFVEKGGAYRAGGIASFGPLILDPSSASFGRLGKTPKAGWSDVDLLGWAASILRAPVGIDTDVAAAALAEAGMGAGADCASLVYVTVGTGIGGGIALGAALPADGARPEMGHVFPRRHPQDTDFPGLCPFHGDCLEGLVSGPAIEARWGAPLSRLPDGHPAHEIVAHYLADFCHQLTAILNPGKIILGGGVMKTSGLLDRIRAAAQDRSGGYFGTPAENRIVPPGLGDRSGILGAYLLARQKA